MIDRYAWRGGEEAMLRFGPSSGPVAIVAMPLFEEANRTRAFANALCRALADRGVASALPDLPGTGESLVETRDARLADWRAAFAGAVETVLAEGRQVAALAIRGGVLVDGAAAVAGRYHFARVEGAALVRDLLRTRLAAASEDGTRFDPHDLAPPGDPIELAGNLVSRELLAELQAARPSPADRTVRLATDPSPADLKLDAAPLWRRAESGQDEVLAARLAEDFTEWRATCAG